MQAVKYRYREIAVEMGTKRSRLAEMGDKKQPTTRLQQRAGYGKRAEAIGVGFDDPRDLYRRHAIGDAAIIRGKSLKVDTEDRARCNIIVDHAIPHGEHY